MLRALLARRRGRRGDFEHQGDLTVPLDGDEIAIEMRVYEHPVTPSLAEKRVAVGVMNLTAAMFAQTRIEIECRSHS